MGWTSLPLLKKTSSQDEEMSDSCPSQIHESKLKKCKVRPAPLVLTLTDEQAALAVPESNQLLHRQLRKRYYAQVLNFMRMVEGAKWVFFPSFLFSSLLSLPPSLLSFGKKRC